MQFLPDSVERLSVSLLAGGVACEGPVCAVFTVENNLASVMVESGSPTWCLWLYDDINRNSSHVTMYLLNWLFVSSLPAVFLE